MVQPLHIKAEELRPLEYLNDIQQGLPAYYLKLRTSRDIYLKVGAWSALLETKQIHFSLWDELLSLCEHAAVRKRAFEYFNSIFRYDLAQKAADAVAVPKSDYEQRVMQAELAFDGETAANAQGGVFLATADLAALTQAASLAEKSGGWRSSLAWALRAAALAPLVPGPHGAIYTHLNHASRADLLSELANIWISRNLHLQTAQIFLARAALIEGDAQLTLKRLTPFTDQVIAAGGPVIHFSAVILQTRAEAEEKLGNHKRAYDLYVQVNERERDKSIVPESFQRGVKARKALQIPSKLPPVDTPPVLQMLGFPRSGTTLLENVLNAHPAIETFEEIPAGQVCVDRIERVRIGRAPAEDEEATYNTARVDYYGELARRRRKPEAGILIDKMPIRSADATFYANLFPEWRYIFSVRHPFDVVLSCFKQRFKPNAAMENFRTFEGSARLYDFTMKEWFERFSLDHPAVHYVRYDSLVTDFEATTRNALAFLGVPWVDDVKNFAAVAEKRAAMTPSYQKVRKGLSVGVQTYWRNYDFLFKSKAAEPLYKWAEKFGYPTS